MAVPFGTTTITVDRWKLATSTDPDAPTDPYDATPQTESTPAKRVKAVITEPTASVVLAGGDEVVWTARITCDPCDMQAGDQLVDNTDKTVWTVLWARAYGAFGLGHMTGELRLQQGVAP